MQASEEDIEFIDPYFTFNDVKDKDLSELRDMGALIPPLHCYAEGTQVYTDSGFKDFKDVDIEKDKFLSLDPDSQEMEFLPAIKNHTYRYDGLMKYFHNNLGSVKLCVTPNHTMVGLRRFDRGQKGRVIEVHLEEAELFAKSPENYLFGNCKNSNKDPDFIWINDTPYLPKAFCYFMGLYLSEGNVNYNRPVISQEKYKNKMFKELQEYGFEVALWSNKIQVKDTNLGEYCKQFGYSHQKFIPDVIFTLSPETINVFLDAYILGDGSRSIGNCFGYKAELVSIHSSSIKMANDLVRLMLLGGHSASWRTQKTKGKLQKFKNGEYFCNHDIHTITRLNSNKRKFKCKDINYSGFVYDVELEKNHTLLIKTDNCILWSGNSNCRSIVVAV
jgi:intein/homing endonuclease